MSSSVRSRIGTPSETGTRRRPGPAPTLAIFSNPDNRDEHPHAAIEPLIPGIFQSSSAPQYELSKIWAGGSTDQEGADKIAAAWEKITAGIGRDKQIELYKASLG